MSGSNLGYLLKSPGEFFKYTNALELRPIEAGFHWGRVLASVFFLSSPDDSNIQLGLSTTVLSEIN
jgi:hypothetical protein